MIFHVFTALALYRLRCSTTSGRLLSPAKNCSDRSNCLEKRLYNRARGLSPSDALPTVAMGGWASWTALTNSTVGPGEGAKSSGMEDIAW